MRLRVLAATLVIPVGLLAACSNDDAGISTRLSSAATDAVTTTVEDTVPVDTTDEPTTTEARTTTSRRPTTTRASTTTEASTTTTEARTTTSARATTTTGASGSTTISTLAPDATIAPGVTKDELVDQILKSGIVSDRAQAECFVDGILNVFTVDELANIGRSNASGDEVFKNLTPQQQSQLVEIVGRCGLPLTS